MAHRLGLHASPRAATAEKDVLTTEEQFCCELTSVQAVLGSYVMSLVRDEHLVSDIVQETNLVLWRKRHEFDPTRSFRSWGLRIAYLQTLAALKVRRRSRLVFSTELANQLATDLGMLSGQLDHSLLSLRECLARLHERHREVVGRRYERSQSIAEIATDLGRSESAISMLLHRTRLALLQCLRQGGVMS